jgi:hypothetical protein
MHLYEVNPSEHDRVHVVARSSHEAADIFVTWSAAHDRVHESFTVECVRLTSLNPQRQVQVRSAFAAGLVGIAHFDEEIGWTFSAPMWVPLGPDEQPVGDDGASP